MNTAATDERPICPVCEDARVQYIDQTICYECASYGPPWSAIEQMGGVKVWRDDKGWWWMEDRDGRSANGTSITDAFVRLRNMRQE